MSRHLRPHYVFLLAVVLVSLPAAAEAADQKQFQAKLPNGAVVELIGVGEHPSRGHQWWGPDGKELSKPPYQESGAELFPGKDQIGREFAIRISGVPKDAVVQVEVKSGESNEGDPVSRENGSSLRGVAALLPSTAPTATIRVGVAAGPWMLQTGIGTVGGPGWIAHTGGASVQYAPPSHDRGAAQLTIAHNLATSHTRLVAVDKNGVDHETEYSGGVTGDFVLQVYRFEGLKLSQIEDFRFEAKPFQWVEFKGVPLRAGSDATATVTVKGLGENENDKVAAYIRAREELNRQQAQQPAKPPLEFHDVKVGDMAPSFEIQTLEGQPLRLEDYRGKWVLLDFWATWCGPCLGETPNLKAVWDQFGRDERFAMIALTLDSDPQKALSYAQRKELGWVQGFLGNDSQTQARYGVWGIPEIMLIAPDGKITAMGLRGDKIKAAVAEALGEAK